MADADATAERLCEKGSDPNSVRHILCLAVTFGLQFDNDCVFASVWHAISCITFREPAVLPLWQ
jgi:hypothetical protein